MYKKCIEWEKRTEEIKRKLVLHSFLPILFLPALLIFLFLSIHTQGEMSIITYIAVPALNTIPLANKCLFIYKKHPICRSPHQLNFLSVLVVLPCLTSGSDSLAGQAEEVQATGPGYHTLVRALSRCLLTLASRQRKSPPDGAAPPPPPAHLPRQSSAAMAGRRRCSSAPSSGRCRAAPPLQHPARGQRPPRPARLPRKARGGTRGSTAGAAAAAEEAELTARPGRLRAFLFPPPSGGSSPSLSPHPELPLLHSLYPSHSSFSSSS